MELTKRVEAKDGVTYVLGCLRAGQMRELSGTRKMGEKMEMLDVYEHNFRLVAFGLANGANGHGEVVLTAEQIADLPFPVFEQLYEAMLDVSEMRRVAKGEAAAP